MWEIIVKQQGSTDDSADVQVINFGQEFSRLYELRAGRDLEFINLASKNDLLLLSYDKSSQFDVFVFCGPYKHYDFSQDGCVNNP